MSVTLRCNVSCGSLFLITTYPIETKTVPLLKLHHVVSY